MSHVTFSNRDLLHPLHGLTVERFLNGDVHESRRDEVEAERAEGADVSREA